jgi:hypothetical protein
MAIQILPQEQGLGESLADMLGGLITGGLEGYNERKERQYNQQIKDKQLHQEQEFKKQLSLQKSAADYKKALTLQLLKQRQQSQQGDIIARMLGGGQQGTEGMQGGPNIPGAIGAAAASGLNPQLIGPLANVLATQQKAQSTQEAPQRKSELDDAREILSKLPEIRHVKKTAAALVKLADSPNLNTGTKAAIIDKMPSAIKAYFNNPTNEAAEKMTADLSLSRLTGMKGTPTDAKLEEIAKSNGSALNTRLGFRNVNKLQELKAEAEEVFPAEIEKLFKKYRGKVYPLGFMSEARDNSEKRLEEIEQERSQLVDQIAAQMPEKTNTQKVYKHPPAAWKHPGQAMNKNGQRIKSDGRTWKVI